MARAEVTGKKIGSDVEGDAFTVAEFCARHRISTKFFYKRPDLMPVSFYLGTRRLISREAVSQWLVDRQAAAVTDAAVNAAKRKRAS